MSNLFTFVRLKRLKFSILNFRKYYETIYRFIDILDFRLYLTTTKNITKVEKLSTLITIIFPGEIKNICDNQIYKPTNW